jgi:hypothetical protein
VPAHAAGRFRTTPSRRSASRSDSMRKLRSCSTSRTQLARRRDGLLGLAATTLSSISRDDVAQRVGQVLPERTLPAIRAANVAITVRSADERIALVLVK